VKHPGEIMNEHRRDASDARLSGWKVALLATHGFEASELFRPLTALRDAGAEYLSSRSPGRRTRYVRGTKTTGETPPTRSSWTTAW